MPRKKKCGPSERQCLICGKLEPRKLAGKTVFLCSRECWLTRRRQIWRKQRPPDTIPLTCAECGNQFVPHQNIRYKAKFCSFACNHRAYRKRAYGRRKDFFAQKSRRWREGHKWGGAWYQALQRDRFTCQLCGFVGSENSLKERSILVHHLDGEGETGDNNHALENLVTVCYDCHEGLHGISLVLKEGRWQFEGKVLRFFAFQTPEIKRMENKNDTQI